ncbi:actin-like protein arp8 [Actinomortierella wolfii]|nr:actin-like protein arp8 [Actinomortierella wolfii]
MEDITMHGQGDEHQQTDAAAATPVVNALPDASSSSAAAVTAPEPMDVDSATTNTAHEGEDVSMEASLPEQKDTASSVSQESSAGQTVGQDKANTNTSGAPVSEQPQSNNATDVTANTATADDNATGTMAVDHPVPSSATTDSTLSTVEGARVPPTISVTDTESSLTSSTTDIDPVKKEEKQTAVADPSTNSHAHQGTNSGESMSALSDASASQKQSENAEGATSTTTAQDATSSSSSLPTASEAPAPAPAPSGPAPVPYTPQFRFTTFSSVAPLPTRNVTSNYLKSERNYVLRDRAATGDRNVKTLGKRRKRSQQQQQQSKNKSGQESKNNTSNNNNNQSSTGLATPSKQEDDEDNTPKRKKTIFELFNEYNRTGGGTEGETEDDVDDGDDDGTDRRSRRGGGRGRKQGMSQKRRGGGGRRSRGAGDDDDEDEDSNGSEDNDSDSDTSGTGSDDDDDSEDDSDPENDGSKRARRQRHGSDSDSDLEMNADAAALNADAVGANADDPTAAANGETAKPVREIGSNVIVIHPGSRNLRIGRASDAYPIDLPHVIARRMYPVTTVATDGKSTTTTTAATEAGDDKHDANGDGEMEVDEDEEQQQTTTLDEEDEDIDNFIQNSYLEAIEYDLRSRMKAAKRRPVPNAKSQVRSFNSSTRPEEIKDHNDPHKVEWTDPLVEDEQFFIGQKALNLPPSWLKKPSTETGAGAGGAGRSALNRNTSSRNTGNDRPFYYEQFWPIIGGKLNDRDYDSLRVLMADLERIWTKVIQDDLKIEPRKLGKYYALLIIPDMYNKTYVTEMIGMLLHSMRFRGVMVQQEAVCATFGAGVSAACVVDIGAEVTKVSCVEDGICLPDSRAVLRYGGDDITRSFTALVRRNGFPYQDLVFSKRHAYYDWRLMEELKEKWCTMNEADLTVQVYTFFVRKPDHPTLKYQLKVYDEVALAPSCLFFPGVIGRPTAAMCAAERERYLNPKPGFCLASNEAEDANEDIPPAVSVAAMFSKKAGGGEKATGKEGGSGGGATAAASAPAASTQNQASPAPGETGSAQTSVAGTPVPTSSATMITASGAANNGSGNNGTPSSSGGATTAPPPTTFVPTYPFPMDPSVQTTNVPYEVVGTIGKDDFSSFAGLDVVVAQSIANCGSEERSKKLYSSIILVGGGGMTPGFDRVLEDRLFQALPASLTTVEKVEVLPSPRDLDPRLLVWKGASVLSKLDTAKELWIKPQEWLLLGKKILRERALFAWQ